MRRKFFIRITFTTTLFMVLSIAAHSQTLLLTPAVDSILDPTVVEKSKSYPRGGTIWFVFSDQGKNPVYSSSNTGNVVTRVNFLDMFNVVDETEHFVKVVRPGNTSNPIGWMPKKNLILLPRCIRKPNRVAKKAMIINTLQDLKQSNRERHFYTNPTLETPFTEGESINIYTICYVYKESDSAILLGHREDCSSDVEAYFQEQVFGWIHKDNLTPWNSRGCLQPNYHDQAPKIRSTKESPAVLFDELQWSCRYKDSDTYKKLAQEAVNLRKNPIVWKDDDFSGNGWAPSKFRLPFLSKTDNSGCIKVGVLGDITDESGRAMMELIEAVRDDYTASKINNLNVVFVIDGTYSIKDYFPPIVKAINKSANKINSNPKYSDPDNPNRIIVNWGSVIYRDSPEGDFALETYTLTQDYSQLSAWLEKVYHPDKNKNDKDLPEAMYYGLFNALEDVLAEKEQENNLIILIGDAGDHQRHKTAYNPNEDEWTFIEADDIIESMIRLKCNFIAFQAHYKDPEKTGNKADSTFNDFQKQSRFIAEKSAKGIYLNSKPNVSEEDIFMINNKSKNFFALNEGILANKIVYSTGVSMSEEALTDNIVNSIDKSAQSTSVLLSMLYDLLYGGKPWSEIQMKYGVENLPEADFSGLSYIIEQVKRTCNCSDDSEEFQQNLEWMLSGKTQLYFEGFTPIRSSNSEMSLWAFDVLASSSGKKQLIQELRRVEKAFIQGGADQHRQRVLINSTLVDLARIYAGDTEGELDNMQIGTLFEQIIDCPGIKFSVCYADILSIRIRDILLEDRCSVEQLKVLYRGIRSARTLLERVDYENYGTRAFKTFTAYWIPIERFPFMVCPK